jgi:uncharacterized repeat protein (TIGR01451 family)
VSRSLLIVLVVLLLCGVASAQTDIYHIRGNTTSTSDNIWSVDSTSAAQTVVFTNYPGGNAATLAQRASDGMLFYVINPSSDENGPVYRFNPATPSIAPVLLGNIGPSTNGNDVGAGFRMAFLGNTLYYMPGGGGSDNNTLYTVNQTTGRATPVANISGTGSGGDMAFSAAGTLYIINQNRQLYTASIAGGAATSLGTVTFPGGATPSTLGLAFDSVGRLLIQTQSPSNMYRITLPSLSASFFGNLSGGTSATGDLASANVPAPDFSITKTNGVTSVYRGGPVSYTVVVTNNGTYTVTGTVTDNVPASVTGVTWNCVASAGSACTTASGSGNSINTSTTLLAGGTATYTITGTLSANASGTLTNTATVAIPSWLTDATPANNTATDSDTIHLNANLGITKTDGLTNINPGSAITYTIVVSNAGPDTANGSIFSDSVPASITGVTWTCGSPTGGATCGAASGSGNSINTTANLPSGSTLRYTVTGTLSASASGTLTNTARIVTAASGVSDPNDLSRTGAGNNSATDNTTINPLPPNIGLVKSVSPNGTQLPGTDLIYTIVYTNSGGRAATSFVLVDPNPLNTDPLERVLRNVDFKVGSMVSTPGTTGLVATFQYSNDGGATWTYTPVSGAGGAPAGYDRAVTNVRWSFAGSLSNVSPNNSGSVSFTVRIR